jgi:hypothetical protein
MLATTRTRVEHTSLLFPSVTLELISLMKPTFVQKQFSIFGGSVEQLALKVHA